MTASLTEQQRRFAVHRIMFDRPLSTELSEALHRAQLACPENNIQQTDILEFVCGLILHYRDEVDRYFSGDLMALLRQVFPKHRFGMEGMVPQSAIDQAADDGESCSSGTMYEIHLSDRLVELLWTAMRLANAVGKKASLKDVVAAISMHDGSLNELKSKGIGLRRGIADFRDVLRVIFHASVHSHPSWTREINFEVDGRLRPPFIAVLKTPSGGFQPMRKASVSINDKLVGELIWPGNPEMSVPVDLQKNNTVKFDVDGPQFGSMELTIFAAKVAG